MRRHRAQDFMGGAYVFPGGRLDVQDCDPALEPLARKLDPSDATKLLEEPALDETTALALFFAAIRETFEECGVLLARDETGSLIRFSEGETAGRFATHRLGLLENKLSLRELAERETLCYAPDLLVPYAHWITPEVESKRFDTRFFLCRHPQGQAPYHDNMEMTKSLWITPAKALEEHEEGRILLMPPTLKTLEELSRFSSTDDLFSFAHAHCIHTILPDPFVFEGGFGVKLPHDPEYSLVRYRRTPRPGEASRIVMREGKWRLL